MANSKRLISVVTGTRAEFGLLAPLIRDIIADDGLNLQLVVTGAHLCAEYGATLGEIERLGFPVAARIDILPEGASTPIYEAVSIGIREFSRLWLAERPDLVVLLGDRYEAFAAASAAAMLEIPIAHIGGGDVTAGAKDEFFRHCITKMSALHFPICTSSRERIITMGERPETVFLCGSLGSQNIASYAEVPQSELASASGLDINKPFLLVTCHPETLGNIDPERCTLELLAALDKTGMQCLFTAANADEGGEAINAAIAKYCEGRENAVFVKSLGARLYISALRACAAVVGNSSSGAVEAPAAGKPCVNIGERQRGRELGAATVCCGWNAEDISAAIEKAASAEFAALAASAPNPYGGGDVSGSILREIKRALESGISVKKEFYDGEGGENI